MDLFLTSPWPYLVTAVFAALTGWYVWHQPRRPGTRYFGWLVSVWLVWTLAAMAYIIVPSIPARFALWGLQSVCMLLEVPLQLMIVLEYTGHEKWLTRRSPYLLFLPALILAVMMVFWPSAMGSVENNSGFLVLVGRDPARLIVFSFMIVVVFVTLAVLFACLLRAPAFRVPVALLMMARLVPTLGYGALDTERVPVPPIQITVLFVAFTMLLYFVALYSFRLLQVSPVARDTVIAHMPNALIVLDAENRLVDFNDGARNLPGMPARLSLRQAAEQELSGWWELLIPLIGPDPISRDVTAPAGSGGRIFHVASLPLNQASGRQIGQAFLLEDVTQARQAQQQQEQAQRALAMLREREQLARELHDSTGQVLGYAGFQLEAIARLVEGGQTDGAILRVKRLAGVMRDAHADVREYILGLQAAPAPQQPFFEALRRYLDGFTSNYGIPIMLDVDERLGEEPFSPDARMQVFRILQEALSNARRHGRASCVKVTFAGENSLMRMAVQDDGVGFDPAQSMDEGHFGLRFMQERAEVLGGSVKIESAPGMGTRVVLMVKGRSA